MQLSVIILNYKVPHHLMLCLESLTKSLSILDAEIIVVDNHSKDESCRLVRTHFPEVYLLANPTNDGFSKGNNIGVAKASGELICLLNPDTAVGEQTFEHLLAFAEKHPDFGAIGPKMIDGRGRFLPESKRNVPTPKIALKKLLNRSDGYYSSLKENETGKAAILSGAFMLMRKDRYQKVGGLDEDYFMYGEDIDLSYKLLKAGFQNYYAGSETVLHFKGESTAKDRTYLKNFYGAMRIFYHKHFQKNAASLLFVKMGLKLAKARHSLLEKENRVSTKALAPIWVGEANGFSKKLGEQIGTPFKSLAPKVLPAENPEESLIVFDAEAIPYAMIFRFMETLKSNHNHFRIKPKGFGFIIGSDSKTHKGEVLVG